MEKNVNDEKIDFVMIWVDGSDPKWQEEKIKYSDNPNAVRSNINRYRDWDNLKYWFRGVEKFAPWVNNVYFITCGHYPKWLNLNHPKLKFLKHEDYMPKEYLPTFSSHPIELNLHRIEGLSDKFVYFNDDMFLIDFVKKDDFFDGGIPRYIAGCDIVYSYKYSDPFSNILTNDVSIINQRFRKNEVIKQNLSKWFNLKYGLKTCLKTLCLLPFSRFPNFADPHIPEPILKSTMKEMWKLEENILDKTSKNKFRGCEDVNQYVFRWYDISRGNFKPSYKKMGRYYDIRYNLSNIIRSIEEQKYKMICISDDMEIDFEAVRDKINNSLDKILPDKSKFEI